MTAQPIGPGGEFELAAPTKAEFAALMRHAARREGLTGGQIHAKSGIPKETVYRYLRESTTTFPRNIVHVQAFFLACNLDSQQITTVVGLWHELNGTKVTAESGEVVVEAELVDSDTVITPAAGAESNPHTPPGGIRILGNVRGDVHVTYVSNAVDNVGGALLRPLFSLPRIYMTLMPPVLVVLLPYLMLRAWEGDPAAVLPKSLIVLTFPVGALFLMDKVRQASVRRNGSSMEWLLSWETGLATAFATAGGFAVGTAVEWWWSGRPAHGVVADWPAAEAVEWIVREGYYRSAVAGTLFGILVFVVTQATLYSMDWTKLWSLTQHVPGVVALMPIIGITVSVISVDLMHTVGADRNVTYVGLIVGVLVSLLGVRVITENRWLCRTAERRAANRPMGIVRTVGVRLAERDVALGSYGIVSSLQSIEQRVEEPADVNPERVVEDSVGAFCADLAQLKNDAGVSFREMSRKTFYSKSTLADAVNPARGLPQCMVVQAFITAVIPNSVDQMRESHRWTERHNILANRTK